MAPSHAIDNPLWQLAARLADWLDRQGVLEHQKSMTPHMGDTLWRDEGYLPSGDRFQLWMACEL